MSYLHLVPGRAEDPGQVRRLNAFMDRMPGATVLRPSGLDHPWELTVPEPDGYRVLVDYDLAGLMAKADRHYPDHAQ